MKLASKEADETDYWLALCKFSKGYPDTDYLIDKLNELTRIMSKIIATSKKNLK